MTPIQVLTALHLPALQDQLTEAPAEELCRLLKMLGTAAYYLAQVGSAQSPQQASPPAMCPRQQLKPNIHLQCSNLLLLLHQLGTSHIGLRCCIVFAVSHLATGSLGQQELLWHRDGSLAVCASAVRGALQDLLSETQQGGPETEEQFVRSTAGLLFAGMLPVWRQVFSAFRRSCC